MFCSFSETSLFCLFVTSFGLNDGNRGVFFVLQKRNSHSANSPPARIITGPGIQEKTSANAKLGANKMKNVRSRKIRGQGMTEYIIIVALIAVAAIGVYRLFGDTLRLQMAGLAKELSGESGSGAQGEAKTKASAAETAAKDDKDLSNYYKDNQK